MCSNMLHSSSLRSTTFLYSVYSSSKELRTSKVEMENIPITFSNCRFCVLLLSSIFFSRVLLLFISLISALNINFKQSLLVILLQQSIISEMQIVYYHVTHRN